MELVKSIKKWIKGVKEMKFDIYNRTTKQYENGLFADSPQMLKSLYAMSGDDIEITKVYNEKPNNDLTPEDGAIRIKLLGNTPSIPAQVAPQQKDISVVNDVVLPLSQIKGGICIEERIFSDNGTEYKINGFGSFKKSWVDVDATQFRVVDIETGKESKLKNKKIQTLDWVKIG